MSWDKAIEFVLSYEGGYVDDQFDPGGATNFGISQKAYPGLNIKELTVEKAKEIYKKDYWDACHCDELPPEFALAVFDCAVNQGVGKAKRLLQISVFVEVDGVVGPKTIAAAFKAESPGIRRFLANRLVDYNNLMIEREALRRYAFNWFFRVFKLFDLISQHGDGTNEPTLER